MLRRLISRLAERSMFGAALFIAAPALACGVSARVPGVQHVAYTPAAAPDDEGGAGQPGFRITFLGHASFLLETAGHVTAVTDYNGFNIPDAPPLIATMNHAHSTHYTLSPDPRIAHVLHGWSEDGTPPVHDLTVGDLHVRNLATNIRDWNGGTEEYGNSVFVFESAGLCIAHLGHLHHLLTPDDIAFLGPIDVVMAPIDGTWTMNQPDMVHVIDDLHAPVVIPMHYYGSQSVLRRFLALVADRYDIKLADQPTVTITRATLPARPEILVVPGPPG